MRQSELRLRALARDLEECREALRDAHARYERELRRRGARRRRLVAALAVLGIAVVVGMAGADTPGFGAVRTPGVVVSCGPGTASATNASFSYSGRTVTATYTVLPGCEGTVITLASYSMLGKPQSSYPQTLFDSASSTAGGTHSLTIRLPDCFWQVDLMTVAAPPTLDPVAAHETWAQAHAATVIGALGGASPCTNIPPPTTTGETTTTTTTTTSTPTTTTPITTTTSTFTTTPTASTTSTFTTTPTASTTTTPATTTTTTAAAPPPASPVADVAVTKVADKSSAVVGQQVSYVLTVTNNGPAPAAAVVLVDELPSQESLVSVSDPACTGTQVITCNYGTLDAGASRSVTIVTLARSPGDATNPATVTTTTPETTAANNRAQVTVPISGPFVPPKTPCAVFTLDHGPLVAGREATVVVTARRDGIAASGVRVTVHGPGIDVTKITDSAGHARFVVRAKSVGLLRVQLVQRAGCPTVPQEIPIPGAFKPPRLTG